MDPAVIAAIIESTVNAWVPIILMSIKTPAGKVKAKKVAPGLRIAGKSLISTADAIEALPKAKKRIRK